MDKTLIIALSAVVLLVIFGSMWFSWRMRQQKGATAPMPTVDVGPVTISARGLYVATTKRENSLERFAIKNLTYRAQGLLSVNAAGISFVLNGEGITTLPRELLTAIRSSNVTIDKAVEPEGLTVIDWQHPDLGAVSSYFRISSLVERPRIENALHALIGTTPQKEEVSS